MKYKNPTTNAIKNVIKPFLESHGFIFAKQKDFYRIRDDFLDCISFGFGRWGSDTIYIYYSVHLLIDPISNINVYKNGGRLSSNWSSKNHEVAITAAKEIIIDIEQYAFEWFGVMNSLDKFQGAWDGAGIIAAFVAIAKGQYDNAMIFLNDIMNRKAPLIYDSGFPGWRESESGINLETHTIISKAINAIDENSIDEWRKNVIAEKFQKLGIKQ